MPCTQIDLTDAGADLSTIALKEEDLVLFAVPSYGGRVPALAADRIRKLRADRTPCVLLCVYGNRAYDDTLTELENLVEESGFRVIAAVAAVAEHSILHQYGAGRPDGEDEKELKDFAKKILEKLEESPAGTATVQIPGNRPYRKAGGAGLVPKADDRCERCGLCAGQCPAGAIDRENPRETDAGKCISCMRCVAKCPHGARRVNKAMVSAAALALKKACSTRKGNELFL